MSTANFELLDLEAIRGALGGVYFGPQVHVLVRCGDRRVIFVPGHSAWNGTGQPWRYEPAGMFITRPRDHYNRLASGGRFNRMIADHAAAIDAEFGEGVSKLIDPGKTLVIA